MEEFDAYARAADEIALSVGKFIQDFWNKPKDFQTKSEVTSVDLFTEADVEVEKRIINHFKQLYPTHRFLGEESSHSEGNEKNLTDDPTWIIDPVDGTTNFVHGIPQIAICIALAIKRKAVVSVVYNPITNEKFSAIRGKGAFLNGKKLSVSNTPSLGKAVVSTNIGYSRNQFGSAFMLNNINKLLNLKVRAIRMTGSAGLSICEVAAGRFDSFYEWGVHAWDVAASGLIVMEAGGVCVSFDENGALHTEFELQARNILCGNKTLVAEMADVLKGSKWTAKEWEK